MNSYLKFASAAVVLTVTGACTSVKITRQAPPVVVTRTSEDISRRIETVAEEDFSPERADVAMALRVFAGAYQAARRYSVAETLYQRALAIQEAATPQDNEAIAQTLRDLITLYRAQKRSAEWAEVEPLIQRYLSTTEKVTGPNKFKLVQDLQEFAGFYEQDQQCAKAEPLLRRALTLSQSGNPGENGMWMSIIDRLARDYTMDGKVDEAEGLFKERLAAQEKIYGENSPRLLFVLQQYVALLRQAGKTDEAERLEQRVQAIRSQPKMQTQSSTNLEPGIRRIPFQREQ